MKDPNKPKAKVNITVCTQCPCFHMDRGRLTRARCGLGYKIAVKRGNNGDGDHAYSLNCELVAIQCKDATMRFNSETTEIAPSG